MIAVIKRVFKIRTLKSNRLLSAGILKRAEDARRSEKWAVAAALYREAAVLDPGRLGLIIQQAHMHKEAGEFAEAEPLYLHATEREPTDGGLAHLVGHFYKSAGRLDRAAEWYRRAQDLSPDGMEPRLELERLTAAGFRVNTVSDAAPADVPQPDILARAGERLAPELVARAGAALLHERGEGVVLKHLGRRERTDWGVTTSVRGVEALRGYCLSRTPVLEIQIMVNRQLVYRGKVSGGYRLKYEPAESVLRKYVFNVWFDFSDFVTGRSEVEFRFVNARLGAMSRTETIVVLPALLEADFPESDALFSPRPGDPRSIDEQINARPSVVRAGRRAMLSRPPRKILVQRADQLGDVVVSVPAVRRLRAIFPDASLVGLVSALNHDLVKSLRLFDELIVIAFPEDRWEQHRVMSLADQEALRSKLEDYKFDLAIDLSESEWSRYLLLLANAPVTVGFRCSGMPSLTIEIEGNTHDRLNNHEIVPHTNKILGLIEWMGAMVRSEPNVVHASSPRRETIEKYGIGAHDTFVVLHDGARFQASRWPYYRKLADKILQNTDHKVIYLTDDAAITTVQDDAIQYPRLTVLSGKLPFEDFDALLALSTAFVGNDSGPKHVAALRGANVVSIHMARNNWREWGQESGGAVVSRRVPCNGCLVNYEPEDCGRDFVCMTNITVDEVFAAVLKVAGSTS